MSDHNERACTQCGSLLHHEDDCPNHPNNLSVHHGEPSTASDTAREAAEPSLSDARRSISHVISNLPVGKRFQDEIDMLTEAQIAMVLSEQFTAVLRREVEGLKAQVERDFIKAAGIASELDEAQQQLAEAKALSVQLNEDRTNAKFERDEARRQLAEATKERNEARARVETLKIKLVSLSDVLPEWSTADWEYAEGTNPRLIAGEFTFGDALALRAAIDAAGGKCRECGSVLPKHQADCGLDAPV